MQLCETENLAGALGVKRGVIAGVDLKKSRRLGNRCKE